VERREDVEGRFKTYARTSVRTIIVRTDDSTPTPHHTTPHHTRAYLFFRFALRASTQLHDRALKAVLAAPLSFFHSK
jgi:hypothetical protein